MWRHCRKGKSQENRKIMIRSEIRNRSMCWLMSAESIGYDVWQITMVQNTQISGSESASKFQYWPYFTGDRMFIKHLFIVRWNLNTSSFNVIKGFGMVNTTNTRQDMSEERRVGHKRRSRLERNLVSFGFYGICLKGTVHPKMKIQSLSTHTYTDGRVGEVF